MPKNTYISHYTGNIVNDDKTITKGPVTIDISKEDNNAVPMINSQLVTKLDTESPYVKMARVFTPTEMYDRTNTIAREFSSQLDGMYDELLENMQQDIDSAPTPEEKRKLEEKLARLKDENHGRKLAIMEIGFKNIADEVKTIFSDMLELSDEELEKEYGMDPEIIKTKLNNTLEYFDYLLEDACNIIEMNEGIRIVIEKHKMNDGKKDKETTDGSIAESEKEKEDNEDQMGDNENGETVSGNEGWTFKVREVDPHMSLSKGTKRVLRDIIKIRPDGKCDNDDLGYVRYVREDIAHATLMNELSKMLITSDDFAKFDSDGMVRLYALEKIAIKYPWVHQVIDRLREDPKLVSLFYTDFRKDFISYWTQKFDESEQKTKTFPLNQAVAKDSTMSDVIRNYENRDMMSTNSIYDSNGKINKENCDKGIKLLDTTLNSLKDFDEDNLDSICENINEALRMIGFNSFKSDITYLYNEETGRNQLARMVSNIREIFTKAKDLGENEHLIDTLKRSYSDLSELIGTVSELDNIQSYKSNGKSYYSYSSPNYINTQVKKILNDNTRDTYLEKEFKAYSWFYDKTANTWKNSWLRLLESSEDVREHFAVKEVNTINKENYRDWHPNQIKTAFLNEYFSIPETRYTNQYAWYNMPIFSDSPVAMFVRFIRYTTDSEGTFKEKLLPLYRQLVWQEIERIKFCQNRAKVGVMEVQNFDKNGKKFNFFPELNDFVLYTNDNEHFMSTSEAPLNTEDYSSVSFLEALDMLKSKDSKEEMDNLIDRVISSIMDNNFASFQENYNSGDLLKTIKQTGVVSDDSGALECLEEYFWNQCYATSQIIQMTTTDLAYYEGATDFQKRFKEVYAAGNKLFTNSKYGRKIEKTVYIKDNVITSANYKRVQENISKAVAEKRLTKEEGLAILDKFKHIKQTDGQAYRNLKSYRAVLDMMGLWSDEMETAFDHFEHNIYDSKDFDIVWQVIKPFLYTQLDKNDGLGGHMKVPHQNKNSEFLLLATYDILSGVMNKSSRFKGINKFMDKYDIDVVQFASCVKVGGQGVIDINVSKNKVNKTVESQAITLDNGVTIPMSGVNDWNDIKEALDNALEDDNISQDDYNTIMDWFEPTEDEVVKMLEDSTRKKVLDSDVMSKEGDMLGEGFNTSVVHAIPYEDYVFQTSNPEHLFDTESIYGSQYRNLINSDMPDDLEITLHGKTLKAKNEKGENEIRQFYNSLIVENLIQDFEKVRGYFNSIQDLQKELLTMIKGNPKYGRDMLNALQIVKRDVNGVEREVFNLPLHNPSTTTKIQELVNSIFKNHITKQKIKGGKATLASNYGFTRDLKLLKDKDGKYIGAECYLPYYTKKYFEQVLVDVKDENGNVIGQKLDESKLDDNLRKLVGFRIPTEERYSMLPLFIKGFLPQQNGSTIMMPADITEVAGEDFDIDGRFLFLPESRLEHYDYKKAFQDYKESHTVSNNTLNDADKNGVLSSLLEEMKSNEDSEEVETFKQWFEANKDNYKLDIPKLRKVYYNMKKSPAENSREARNNMLIDLGYAILTSEDSVNKLCHPGNFDKLQVEALKSRIRQDSDLLIDYTESKGFKKDISSDKISELLEQETLDSLSKFIKQYQTERNVLNPDTFIYNHHQNMTGGKLIGIYANNNTAHAKFQATNLGIKKGYQFTIDGKTFSSLHDISTEINGITTSILANCTQLSAALVDNIKAPMLAELLQNEKTASIAGTMLAIGMSISQMSLLFTQPLVRKFIENGGGINDIVSLNKTLINLCASYKISLNNVKDDTTSLRLSNNILEYQKLDWSKINPNNINEFEVEDRSALEILNDNIQATNKFITLALIAKDYNDLIRISRADSPNGAMKRNIAQTTNQLHNVDVFKLRSTKNDFTLTGIDDCVSNGVLSLDDTPEEMRKKLNKRPMSMLQGFHSLGIDLGSQLESKVFMQLSDKVRSMVQTVYACSPYNTISDKLLDNLYSDLTRYALSKTKMFGDDGQRTFDEKRNFYLYEFPKKFLEFKLNPNNKDINNLGIIKKLSVVKGKIILQNSGKITGALREMYMRDFENLLYIDNPNAQQFATDLLAYSFYLDGLNFGPCSYGNFFNTAFLNSFPEVVNALTAMETNINSSMYDDYINQFYLNYWQEKGLLPTYKVNYKLTVLNDNSILIPKKSCANPNTIEESYFPLIKTAENNLITGDVTMSLYALDTSYESSKFMKYYPVSVMRKNQGIKYNANISAMDMIDTIGFNSKEDEAAVTQDEFNSITDMLADFAAEQAQSEIDDFIKQGIDISKEVKCK